MTEGDVVRLRGEAFGIYANEIAIGVDCSETIATDVEPGMDTITGTDASTCYHLVTTLLPPGVQPFLAESLAILLGSSFTSVISLIQEASHVTKW